MQIIEKYNCDGICAQEFCDKRYTNFRIETIHGMRILIALCSKHAYEFETNILRGIK